jgi:hypothetical protein
MVGKSIGATVELRYTGKMAVQKSASFVPRRRYADF